VLFNVGGRKFMTTKETLMRFEQTVFSSIIKGRLKPDKKGYYCFDRSSKNFEYILDYLRTGRLMVKENWDRERLEYLMEDLDYFQVPYCKEVLLDC